MNLRPILRGVAVFIVAFGAGIGALVLLASGDHDAPRRGIRIEETAGPAGGASVTRFDGIPTLLSTESPQYSRFVAFTFPTGVGEETETLKILSWHLACDRIDMMEERAVGVRFRIFPQPADLAQARDQAGRTPVASVEIGAGQARMERFFRTPEGASEPQEDWLLKLSSGVEMLSREDGAEAKLEADDLDCYVSEQRVVSRGAVAVNAKEYEITGRGLQGDATLGTFTVHEEVVVILPTSALLENSDQAAGATTTFRCPGPLLVERLGGGAEGGPVPTRVTFSNGVSVEQGDAAGETTAELRAGELRIELLVSPDEGGEHEVAVKDLAARGDVLLTQGGESSVRADALTLERLEDGLLIRLEGASVVRHEGPMPGTTEEEPEIEILTIRSGSGAEIRRIEKTERTKATFTGGVTASRSDREGNTLLTLAAKTLVFQSNPTDGECMTASGEASLTTSTLTGTAGEIVWKSTSPTDEEVRFEGSPRLEARGGAGFDPFGKSGPPEGDAEVHLSCVGDMVLVTKGESRTFTMEDGATIVKLTKGVEEMRVEADSIEAKLEGEEFSSLSAVGGVVAEGRGEGEMAGDYFASGDSFVYTAGEHAVLSGAPAIARITEDEEQANEIRATRVLFGEKQGRFIAEDGVQAVVFLRSEGGKRVRPFALKCGRLTVTPVGEGEEGGLAGRIKSLVAEEEVALSSQEREARGDLLTYGEVGPSMIVLTGKPALVIERVQIAGQTYENSLTSDELQIVLEDEELKRATTPNGGTIVMHRPFEGDGLSLAGSSGDGAGKPAVERLNVSCRGRLTYGGRHGIMKTAGRVEQWQGSGDDFKLIARILADTIEVKLRLLPDGTDQLVSASGAGNVRVTGDAWKAQCNSFTIEFVRHRLIVEGTPALVTLAGSSEQRFSRVVYDYVNDKLVEGFRVRK